MKALAWLWLVAAICPELHSQSLRRVQVQGEMGARGVRPGNTLPAFEYAVEAGADVIEMDMQVTKDNVIVISHDPILHEPFCVGPKADAIIHELTLAEVKQYDCGSIQYPGLSRQVKVPGTKMPTLDEVFALSTRREFLYNIETKIAPKRRTAEDARQMLRTLYPGAMTKEEENRRIRGLTLQQPEMTPGPEEFVSLVLKSVRKYHLESRVILESFDFRTLAAMKKVEPRVRLAALCLGPDLDFVKIGQDSGAQIISPIFTSVTKEQVKAAHGAGLEVLPWVADEPKDWDRLMDAGVDGILTSFPADLIAYLKKKETAPTR